MATSTDSDSSASSISTTASASSSETASSTSSSHSANFTPVVPNSKENPFISSSSLPEGTLFIAVGSILLGIILTCILWRLYAIWASHRAATYNEARFTALEPSYGGPFVDPVTEGDTEDNDQDSEKLPGVHPVGVPLNPNSKTRAKKQRSKSQADRVREAQLQGKFFSPTAEVLMHGMAHPYNASLNTSGSSVNALGGSSLMAQSSAPNSHTGGYASQRPPSSRLSVQYSGRNSLVQQASMSSTDLSSTNEPPMGPPEGTSNAPRGPPRQGKLRPPSTYLDDLVG